MMHFRIAVDCIIVAYDQAVNQLKVLLVKRVNEPEKGSWALPGGFVDQVEEFVETARRKLWQETGVRDVYLEQLQAYSLTDSSAENRIASIAYYALIKYGDFAPTPGHTHLSRWFPLGEVPALPFDHGQKVQDAVRQIKAAIRLKPIVFYLLPARFPLNQLQKFYEEVYQIKLDNRNFRKRVKNVPYLEELDEVESNVSHRPGRLYQFNREKFEAFLDSIQVY